MKNNKRGLGADKVKKKIVKPDHAADSSKGDNKQVIFFFFGVGFPCYLIEILFFKFLVLFHQIWWGWGYIIL